MSLITKLEAGLNDRLDALLQTRPDPNAAHYYLAGIYTAQHARQLAPSLPGSQRPRPGHRLVRLHQERDARRVLRPEHNPGPTAIR